jgi:hypothetical protein
MRIIDSSKNFHLFKIHGKWLNKRRKKKMNFKKENGKEQA